MTNNTNEQERLIEHLQRNYSDDYLLAYDYHETCKKASLLSLSSVHSLDEKIVSVDTIDNDHISFVFYYNNKLTDKGVAHFGKLKIVDCVFPNLNNIVKVSTESGKTVYAVYVQESTDNGILIVGKKNKLSDFLKEMKTIKKKSNGDEEFSLEHKGSF